MSELASENPSQTRLPGPPWKAKSGKDVLFPLGGHGRHKALFLRRLAASSARRCSGSARLWWTSGLAERRAVGVCHTGTHRSADGAPRERSDGGRGQARQGTAGVPDGFGRQGGAPRSFTGAPSARRCSFGAPEAWGSPARPCRAYGTATQGAWRKAPRALRFESSLRELQRATWRNAPLARGTWGRTRASGRRRRVDGRGAARRLR